ncbi:Importin-11 [Rhizoclosmatium hyalinum]|nr:Importin-11 [Rhizoclosmatium hyalinum]
MAESTAALAQLLVRLATQNDKAVEQQLDQLTHMHMHHYGLLLVAADASVPHSARHLAALYLKNGVDKHWRKTSKRPEAIPSLLTTIESTFNPASPFNQPVLQAPHDINALKRLHLAQQHSIYTLHRVIKGLYSVRTLRVKHVLYQMAPHIFQNLSNLFSSNISIFLSNFPSTDPASTLTDPFVIEKLDGTIQIARLALKILRRLIVNGFPERDDMVRVPEGLGDGKMVAAPNFYKPFEKVEACVELFSSLTGCLQKMLQLRTAVSTAPQLKPIFQATTKISLTIGKLYTDLLNSRAVNFVAARGSLDVIRFYWGPDTNPMWKIIRRRVTMLISYWIAVKSAPSMRPLFYRLLIHLASPANERDMVVRLSAITTLRVVVDEGLLTDSEVFQPFVESCVQVLVELVVEADEFDTKVGGLTALKGIIYMMGQKIAPFAGKITEQLPRLWESSYDQIMFRTSILLVLSTLVQALKEQSVMLHPLVLPAIQATLLGSDMTQQMHFLEDSIDLWVATLQNSPSLTPELVSLYPCLAELIELGSAEHLKVVLRLLESYFVLDAGNFAQHPASLVLFTKLANYLSELKIEASKHIARAVTLVLRAGLQSNNLQAMQHLFVESKLLATLITEILQSSQKGIVDHVVADFTTVVSLFIVWDAGFIINYLQEFGIMVAGKGSSVLPECLDQWNRVYDAMTYPKQRKALGMAMATLVSTANTDVLGKVQGIFATLSGVMMEVHGMSNEELSGS